MYQSPLCKNDRCSKLVPPSKNPGVKRLFCSPACSRRYHARMFYQREVGKTGQGLMFVNEKGQAQVNRRLPMTARAADQRYRNHLGACLIHGGPCPARSDPYGRKRVCLVGSVFADDWSQLKDAEEGRPIRRYATTQDGRWLVDLSDEEKTAIDARVNQQESLTPEQREAFIRAGGATKPEDETQDEALRRYNEGLPLST